MGDGARPEEEEALGSVDTLDGFYLDFDGTGDLHLQFFDESSPPADPSSECSMSPTAIRELEKFLMEDGGDFQEVEQPLPDAFFTDVLFTGSDDGSVESAVSNGEKATTPENAAEEKSDEDVEPLASFAAPGEGFEEQTKSEDSESKDEEIEDNRSKKRTRQMRNRESAMKSRERKKTYVKDLETKSKFMALEVQRLQRALHCFAAENMALRQSLTKAKALSAPLAVQESAVLFAESLLLGSLYWLVSIACLFLAPWAPQESSGATRNQERAVGREELPSTGSQPRTISKNRSCRALRTRMKEICSSLFFPPLYFRFP